MIVKECLCLQKIKLKGLFRHVLTWPGIVFGLVFREISLNMSLKSDISEQSSIFLLLWPDFESILQVISLLLQVNHLKRGIDHDVPHE